MAARLISMEEMKSMVDRMCDPTLDGEGLIRVMNEAARAVGVDNRRRVSIKENTHRREVRAASASGDLAELRRLANKNLTGRR